MTTTDETAATTDEVATTVDDVPATVDDTPGTSAGDGTGGTAVDDTPTVVDGPVPTPRDEGTVDDDTTTTDGGTTTADGGTTGDGGSGAVDETPTVVDGPVPTPRDDNGNGNGNGNGSTAVDTPGAETPTPGGGEVAETPDPGTGSGTDVAGGSDTGTGGTDTQTGGSGTNVAGGSGAQTGGSGTDVAGGTGAQTGGSGTQTQTGGGSGTDVAGGTGTQTGGGSGTDVAGGSGTHTGGGTGAGVASGSGTQGGGSGTQGGTDGGAGAVDPGAPAVVDGSTPGTEVASGHESNGGTASTGNGSATGSGSGTTDTGGAGKPSIVDIVKAIFGGGSRSDSDKTTTTKTATTTTTTTTAPATTTTVKVVAPAAVQAPVVEEVIEEAVATKAAKTVVEVEPKAAATAPRIRYSSGGSRETYRRYELTALGLTPHARQVLGALGFRTLSEHRSPLLGNRIVARLRTPANQTAEAALARARSVLPEVTFDLAHLYRPSGEQAPVRYAAHMIGAPLGATCAVPARVGLIDSGVGAHATLAGASITRKNFVEKGASTNVAHGTAIASILVGDLPGTGPLMPGAQLYSANVFAQDPSGLRADATAIIAALDWMATQHVPVVNLSLMGPPNALLEEAVRAAASRGLVMVAAAGNDGPDAEPAYPAAYPAVIAVSAVDSRGRPYGNNNRGSYIYVAAPGVDIWGADARGGLAFWTGTSFAAPFVTASLARDVALGRVHDTNDGRTRIASRARDMGAPGRDPIYGFGLLQAGSCGGGSGAGAVLSSKN
ncbi:S8 family serine peptidase [Amaricoccus sp.]|uniref:S8 family serine peptidase n=1 Tax=Amaricoccus sp. TaxID=1872485 RepID=UPI001B75F3B2|nr:S8 family serine peptidase [Amaricoccus sp.]MBP7001580.1 S8 family serine peptidase [Amaricoccus sp.]